MQTAKKIERFTYRDYLSWNDDKRREIIDGKIYDMSPAPSVKHQRVGLNIKKVIFKNEDKLNGCLMFDAPTDVVFDEFNVVQPDIFIVCDKGKITEKNIQGAPDLIVEIVSPSTAYKDAKIKKELYEKFGVKEYIIVFPEFNMVERYVLREDAFDFPELFNWDETLKLRTFEVELNLWEIFEKEKE